MEKVTLAVLVLVMVSGAAMGAVVRNEDVAKYGTPILRFCEWPNAYNLAQITPTFWARARNFSQQFDISANDQILDMIRVLKHEQADLLNKKTVFIVHGFINDVKTPWMQQMADSLLQVEDYLVVIIGWGKGADLYLNYAQAAANTQTVAGSIAFAAKNLKAAGVPYTYCVGHSLGAHICGEAGAQYQFDRISGLDPAGPGFENCTHPGLRSYGAQCVDVIHTNGEWDGFGTLEPRGHVDFYPNCGRNQPSCAFTLDIACSHGKAIDYFIDTVNAHSQPAPKLCPSGQGPCDDSFLDKCEPCNDVFGCQTSQYHCQGPNQVPQPMGYGSVCHDNQKPVCGNQKLARNLRTGEYFGQWYVPVNKKGPLSFCDMQ